MMNQHARRQAHEAAHHQNMMMMGGDGCNHGPVGCCCQNEMPCQMDDSMQMHQGMMEQQIMQDQQHQHHMMMMGHGGPGMNHMGMHGQFEDPRAMMDHQMM